MNASSDMLIAGLLGFAFALSGCRRDMADQPRFKPLAANPFFADGAASRPLLAHTVARGELRADAHFFTGRVDGALVAEFPAPVTRAMLERGHERYDIYCAVCHGRTGESNGIVVQRGFPPPTSLHLQRLRDAPVGYFFEVITNGLGLMYPYASRVTPADRWAIVAYIRALQLSQNAALADAEPAQRSKLEALPR
jgi:mono/diheme cytochrome c family protein